MKLFSIKLFVAVAILAGLQGLDTKTASATVTAEEAAIIQQYINSAPALPKKAVKSSADTKAVLDLYKNIELTEDPSEAMPYFSTKSKEMFSRAPGFVSEISNSSSVDLYEMKLKKPKITILSGLQYALVSVTGKQKGTGYTENMTMVMVKESGVWKIDLVSSIKIELDKRNKENPQGLAVKGSGKTDLSIVAMSYEQDNPKVNAADTNFLVQLKNNGKTTIYSSGISLEINGAEVMLSTLDYTLKPKKEIILSIPIKKYWTLPGVTKSPGMYRTEVYVNVDEYGIDANPDDNAYYDETMFK